MSSEVTTYLAKLQGAVDNALHNLEEQDFALRAWKKDPTLWTGQPDQYSAVVGAIGWLDAVRSMQTRLGDLLALASDIHDEGYLHIVVLGMGGSTLGAEVLRRSFGLVPGAPQLLVLDSTDPGRVQQTARAIHPATTMFVVSSKSGLTVETQALLAFFYEQVAVARPDHTGDNFIAITDAGTPLEKLAREKHFRELFLNPADIGGCYSVLSYFGLVPAALAGYNIKELLARAASMADECHKPGLDNPGLHLGAILGAAALNGRDKATLVVSPSLSDYSLWAEQLIAESTGKEGRGIIPVSNEPLGTPEVYGPDRLFISLTVDTDRETETEERLKRLEEAGHPVIRLQLKDLFDLGGEFFRWEFAASVAGSLLGVDSFSRPDMEVSKTNTRRLLDQYIQSGQLPEPEYVSGPAQTRVAFTTPAPEETTVARLREFFGQIRPADYLAFLVYDPEDSADQAELQEIRVMVRDRLKVATTLGYGPRFLHSTGQLHKGGPDNGVFVQVVSPDPVDVPVPGQPYSFSILKQAQAIGDFEALQERDRRIIVVRPPVGLTGLKEIVQAAFWILDTGL